MSFFQALPEEPERIKKIQEHVAVCEEEAGIDHENALKIAGGDFTLKDENSQVRMILTQNICNFRVRLKLIKDRKINSNFY